METLILLPSSPILPKTRASPPSSLSLSSSSSTFFNKSSRYGSVHNRKLNISRTRKGMLGCRCLFGLGVPELVVIAGVAALVFGPKQLPEVGKNIGKTVRSFQQAAKEFETELKKEPDTALGSPPEKPSPTSEGKEDI